MRPMTITRSGSAGSSSIAPMDMYQSPFNVGIGVVVSGTVNYTIQHTFDNVQDSAVTPTWFSHPSLVGLTVSADGNYAFPVTGIKILMNSGTGTVTATLAQAGMPGR